jgi:hypothetical protein
MRLAGAARETLLTKQTLHRLLQHGREAACWALDAADDEAGAVAPCYTAALVYNMRQLEQMESPRAEDDPHRTIGKRPWLIAVALQQKRTWDWEKAGVGGRTPAYAANDRALRIAALIARTRCRVFQSLPPLRKQDLHAWLPPASAQLVQSPGSAARRDQHAGRKWRLESQKRQDGCSSHHQGRWRRARPMNLRRTSVPYDIPEDMAWPQEENYPARTQSLPNVLSHSNGLGDRRPGHSASCHGLRGQEYGSAAQIRP